MTDNEKVLNELEKKYLNDTSCCSHIPASWAVEIFDLLKKIDSLWGIKKNEDIYQGGWSYRGLKYYLDDFFIGIGLKDLPIGWKDQSPEARKKQRKQRFPGYNIFEPLKSEAYHQYRMLYAKVYNRIKKPKVVIDQVKIKFGSLRLYFQVEDETIHKAINILINEVEDKLSSKGSYGSI